MPLKNYPSTGFVYHADYLKHCTGLHHPERPARLTAILRLLEKSGVLSRLISIAPYPATAEQLLSVHTQEYLEKVRTFCKDKISYFDSDTSVCKDSFDVACLAAGGVLAACDAVAKQDITNAFCAVRPPGHHASGNRSMGFCIFNNVAIAARYLQNKYSFRKILIIDWDAHHGNGTQEIFYDDPSVFYFSIHQYPHYPGTGSSKETGDEQAKGYTLNLPMMKESGNEDYIREFQEQLIPTVSLFKPDFILISAGFDCHRDDPLADMDITEEGFAQMTQISKDIAKKCCNGRLVSALEGGYNLHSLASSVEAHIRCLLSA